MLIMNDGGIKAYLPHYNFREPDTEGSVRIFV